MRSKEFMDASCKLRTLRSFVNSALDTIEYEYVLDMLTAEYQRRQEVKKAQKRSKM